MACKAVAKAGLTEKTHGFVKDHASENPTRVALRLGSQPQSPPEERWDCAGEAALDAGVDRTVVSKIERGVTNPSLEILLRLANQLNVPVGQLLLPPVEAL